MNVIAMTAQEDLKTKNRRTGGKGPQTFSGSENDRLGWSFQVEIFYGTRSSNAERVLREAGEAAGTSIDQRWVDSDAKRLRT